MEDMEVGHGTGDTDDSSVSFAKMSYLREALAEYKLNNLIVIVDETLASDFWFLDI